MLEFSSYNALMDYHNAVKSFQKNDKIHTKDDNKYWIFDGENFAEAEKPAELATMSLYELNKQIMS